METFISAVLGDLVSRSVSFVVDRYYWGHKGASEKLQQLCRMLLRIQIIIEEAEGRHITNQAMLRQLQMLREAMYEGSYLHDTVRYHTLQQKSINYKSRGRSSSSLSKLGPAKNVCFCSRRVNMPFQGDGVKEVQEMLGSLRGVIDDMAEFIVFLKSYPPIGREPYSKYMFLEKCMFGRQVEMEQIVNFLLQQDPPGIKKLQVLPIVGPPRVGKSTLVEHVCYDERVRSHFSSIILCSGYPEGGRVMEKQTHGSYGRSLAIVELADDFVLDESLWKKLYSSGIHMPQDSKVIITSSSENIVKLGTTGAIRLKFLPQEAYWYFFKALAFGSTNPEEHPELASIAMEIAELLDGSFLGANTVSGMLRANLNARFWRKILELQRNHVERNILLFGEHPHSLLQKNRLVYLRTMSNRAIWFKVRHHEKHFHDNEVPKIMLLDVHTGSAETSNGKFEVVVWRSQIPPYHSYLMSCEMETPHLMTKKKRPHSMV
ncbi:hypothetical protein BAE44_0017590 [Dichanthelium oligosanthes]|uniref:Disease resistance N-terminal domain-containing protein n=1 Tax=Dichanthelium oligosanthes TaxID=888268 RepID=A0A1E5V8E4_9POAL|nr:hypothetical protein BAE44_0017590 [Dichanthelium oligosanthes]